MISVCCEVSKKYDADDVDTANDEDTLFVHFAGLALKIRKQKNKELFQHTPITFYAFRPLT